MKVIFEKLCLWQKIIKTIYVIAIIALFWRMIYPHTRFFYNKAIFVPFYGRLHSYETVLAKGEEYKLYIYAINKRVTYQSEDISVASVNIFGKVTAWNVGTTVVTAKYGDKKLKCKITVIDLNKKKLKLEVGESSRLKVRNVFQGVTYKSSNPSVAKVSRFGKVKAVGKGSATIIATYKNKKIKCKILVT